MAFGPSLLASLGHAPYGCIEWLSRAGGAGHRPARVRRGQSSTSPNLTIRPNGKPSGLALYWNEVFLHFFLSLLPGVVPGARELFRRSKRRKLIGQIAGSPEGEKCLTVRRLDPTHPSLCTTSSEPYIMQVAIMSSYGPV